MDPATKGRAAGVYAIGSDPKQMRAILEHHLRAPGESPFDVVRCKPSFTRGRGSRSLFQYDVTLRSPEGREWNEVVSGVSYGGNRTRRAWDKLSRTGGMAERESKIRRAAYVADLDLLLQVFPFDHGLPALEPLMAGTLDGLRGPILARFGPGDWQLDEWHSECIRYRVDLRASVKLTVKATESRSGGALDRRFYAKVYGGEEQVERAWKVQQDLAAALQAAGDPFALAPLVAYLPEDRVLVEDERTDPGRVRRSAESLRNSRPDLTAAVAEIEKGICGGLDAVNALPSVPVPGDLKPPHILVEEERVVLLDLDKFAAGDPMLD